MPVEHPLRLFEADAFLDGDKVFLCHHVLYLLFQVRLEPEVPVRDDADELRSPVWAIADTVLTDQLTS